jgi:hypothetical protein
VRRNYEARYNIQYSHIRRSRIVFREKWVTHLLLPLLKVEKHEFVIRKATFGESQADTIVVGRTSRAKQSESWHFRAVHKFRRESGAICEPQHCVSTQRDVASRSVYKPKTSRRMEELAVVYRVWMPSLPSRLSDSQSSHTSACAGCRMKLPTARMVGGFALATELS